MTHAPYPATLALLSLLAACSSRPLEPEAAGGPATISGSVVYAGQMALASDDTIRIVLEDVSLADATAPVLAEQMIAGAGKQVPVPFTLSYHSGWIQEGHRYALRAEIRSAGGALLWTTDTAHPVISNGAAVDDVQVSLARVGAEGDGMAAPQPGQTAVFDCISNGGAFSFTTRTGPGEIALWLPPLLGERYLVLGQIRSASGARYLGDGVMLWNKGDEALLDVDGTAFPGCTLNRRKTIWEHAKLSGVDFRAVGNEPGWHLEIRDDDSIRFVYDYGQREITTSAPKVEEDRQNRRTVYSVESDADRIEVLISGEPCSDSMSGEAFQSRVTVMLDERAYHGCGRALH